MIRPLLRVVGIAGPAAIVAALLVSGIPATLRAQVCFGTPARGGISYDRGGYSYGASNGVTATLGGGHFAAALSAQQQTLLQSTSAYAADLRFAVPVGVSRLSLCPNVGLGYAKRDMTLSQGVSIASQFARASGGVHVGSELPVFKELTVIPTVGARYVFRLAYLQATVPVGTAEASGDTASTVSVDYGATLRYRFAYLGFSAERSSEGGSNRPYFTRLFLGVTWDKGKRAR